MCETRREFKLARNAYKTDKPEPLEDLNATTKITKSDVAKENHVKPKQVRGPRARGEGPRGEGPRGGQREGEKKEWTLIAKKGEGKVSKQATKE